MSDKNKKSESFLRLWIIAGLIFAAVLLIFAGFTWVMFKNFGSGKLDLGSWAEAGATYGILAALFTGLAFAGLIVTILLQRKDLSLQREELRLQRYELRRSGEALENQGVTFEAQLFESSFYRMFEHIDKTRRELKYEYGSTKLIGENVIKRMFDNFNYSSLFDGPILKGGLKKLDYIERYEYWVKNFLTPDMSILIKSYIVLIRMIQNNNSQDKYKNILNILTSNEMKKIFLLYCMYPNNSKEEKALIIFSGLLNDIYYDELNQQLEYYAGAITSHKPLPWDNQ